MPFDLSRCPQTEAEARSWYFAGIGRAIGGPADDYEAVMSGAGLPPGYEPGVVPHAGMPYFAFTNMESSGVSRGRIFLPTKYPDDLDYYTRQIQVIADGPTPGSLVWAWQYISGQQYFPVQGAEDGGSGGGTPDDGDLASRVETLEAMVEQQGEELEALHVELNTLTDRVTALEGAGAAVHLGDKIALRTNSGLIAGIKGGGPTQVDAPIELIGKQNIHAWESFTLEQGE